MDFLDRLMPLLQAGGKAALGDDPTLAAAMRLPQLQNGFKDYGPWGAGGGQPGAGAFPDSPAKTGILQATQSPSAPMQPQFSDAPQRQSPMAAPEQPYSYAMDPSRGGLLSFIGGLSGSPTRAEYNARQVGKSTSHMATALSTLMQQPGMTVQRALMEYMGTPEGQSDMVSNPNFVADAKGVLAELKGPTPLPMENVAPGNRVLDPNTGKVIYEAPAAPKPDYTIGQNRLSGDTNQPVATVPLDPTLEKQNYDNYVADQTKRKLPVLSMQDWHNDQAAHGVEQGATAENGRVISIPFQNYQIDLIKKADGMQAQQQALHDVAVLSKSADTGWVQAATLPFRSLLNSIGVTADDSVPIQQVFKAQVAQLALAARGQNSLSGTVGLTGNTSDKDLAFLTESVPNLWVSNQANQGIIVLAEAQARRQELIARMQANYIGAHGTLDAGWDKEFHDAFKDDKNPNHIDFLNAEEKKTLSDLNAKANEMATPGHGGLGMADKVPLLSEPPAGFPESKEFWNSQGPEWQKQFIEAGPKGPRGEEQGPPYEPGIKVNQPGPVGHVHGAVTEPDIGPGRQGGHAHGQAPAPVLGKVGHAHGTPAPQVKAAQTQTTRGGPRGPQGPSGVQLMQPGNSSMPADQYAQPATSDNFITLQDLLRYFGGGQ